MVRKDYIPRIEKLKHIVLSLKKEYNGKRSMPLELNRLKLAIEGNIDAAEGDEDSPGTIEDILNSFNDIPTIFNWLKSYISKHSQEPKKRGRPAKSKPSEAPIEVDRNVYAHARIRKDDEYMGIIKDLWHKQIITTAKMNNMMGDLEDNKYDKLEKALSEYTKAKPVLHIPSRPTTPEPVYVPKKRGRPSKPVDTSELNSLINEINEHGKHNPVTIASMPAFPKFPKAKPTKEPRSEIKSLKNNIKNKATRMISEIEHSDLMKYISQF